MENYKRKIEKYLDSATAKYRMGYKINYDEYDFSLPYLPFEVRFVVYLRSEVYMYKRAYTYDFNSKNDEIYYMIDRDIQKFSDEIEQLERDYDYSSRYLSELVKYRP